jgi:FKBP-type peptidyl-prolyl cis-trans isomerase
MKKLFILFSLLIIGLSSCQKVTVSSLAATQLTLDDAKIQAYLTANKITATKDASGLYYQVVNTGTTPNPTTSSTVKITYTSAYLNGVSVGRVEGYTARLSTFVRALQIGVSKIGTSGRIILIAPSALTYGSAEHNGIPANSVLYYTVDLNGVSN